MAGMNRVSWCAAVAAYALASPGWCEAPYAEAFRPQFHFSPPQEWMNDPNGMVYFDGEYHLFYQYNPYANVWGPMHWGHAVSGDLVHWDNLPIALFPDRHGTIFSGSAVIDERNTSGFGSPQNPPMVAIFTYNDQLRQHRGESDFQSQGIAYSLDRGRNWTKYEGNPVLPNAGSRDFRDPKVMWHAPTGHWIMTLAVHDHVAFYSSPDLRTWTHESDFGRDAGAHGGVWECPDLIEMTVAGSATRKAVLLVSLNPGGPNGGSATQYFVGRFDGHRFVPDPPAAGSGVAAAWIDYGTDDYAGSTWSGGKPGDERQLFMGWMSNWRYAEKVPSKRWRSAMTIPRELRLVGTPRGLELHSLPVVELDSLRLRGAPIAARSVADTLDLTAAAGTKSTLLELDLALDTRNAGQIDLTFANGRGEKTVLRIDKPGHRYTVDRSASGSVDFDGQFADVQTAPLRGTGKRVAVRAFLDHASLEIFIDDGATVFTTIEFPAEPYDRIGLHADADIRVESGSVHELKSIWDKK